MIGILPLFGKVIKMHSKGRNYYEFQQSIQFIIEKSHEYCKP